MRLRCCCLNRRKDGFPSSFEGGLEEGRGEGQLTLEMLLPDSARQQTYLSLLRKFQGEQSPDKSGGERANESEWGRVCRVIFDAVTRNDPAAGEEGPPRGGLDDSHAGNSSSRTGDPRRDDPIGYELGLHSSSVLSLRGAPATWEASPVSKKLVENAAKESQAKVPSALCLEPDGLLGQGHGVKTDEERVKMFARDPLGIRDDSFDLRSLEIARRKVLDGASRNDAESKLAREGSVLPTDSNFSPLLFLTLVHPEATFKELAQALTRLEGVADNHALRLQRLVRDNFPLFVRCAEGIDWFSDNIGEGVGNVGATTTAAADGNDDGSTNAVDQLNKLVSLVRDISRHSDDAFGPLLNNTQEVKRTKNALTILSRVGPILAVPNVMTSHLQGGRIAEAVSAYRKVRLIDETCGVDLLKSVRAKAMEAAAEARKSLTRLLESPDTSAQKLMSAIRDVRDLDDLDDRKNDGELADGFESPNTIAASEVARSHNPALLCLEAQAKHFAKVAVATAKACTESILGSVQKDIKVKDLLSGEGSPTPKLPGGEVDASKKVDHSTLSPLGPRYFDEEEEDDERLDYTFRFSGAHASLKSAIYSIRAASCHEASTVVRQWLPRLMRVSSVAYDIENQLLASGRTTGADKKVRDVLEGDVADALMVFIELSGQNALGSDLFHEEKMKLFCSGSAGEGAVLHAVEFPDLEYCRSSLPPGFNSKCAQSLSALSDTIAASTASARGMRGYDNLRPSVKKSRGLGACGELVELSIIECEKRWCSNVLSTCARNVVESATARLVLDLQGVARCVKRLRQSLHRGVECGKMIEEGVRGCLSAGCAVFEAIAKEQDFDTTLRMVSECARVLTFDLDALIDAMSGMRGQGDDEDLTTTYASIIKGVEDAIWKDYLNVLKQSVRAGFESKTPKGVGNGRTFPVHMSSALLSIVKNRAVVSDIFGSRCRPLSDGKSYEEQVMQYSCDELLQCICETSAGTGGGDKGVIAAGVELAFLIEAVECHSSPGKIAVAKEALKDLIAKTRDKDWAEASEEHGQEGGRGDEEESLMTRLKRQAKILTQVLAK